MALKELEKPKHTDDTSRKNREGVVPTANNSIFIKGARSNNLRNVDLVIPKNKLVVVTGVSGSGKSSITMDTLFAEGQRRYVESLSSYARQFLMRMKKPDVDYIKGVCPAIAIEQKTTTGNNRSTVGSMTEVYDFLRLLYARIGKTISPVSGDVVKKHQVSDVIDFILQQNDGDRVQLFIPIPTKYDDRTLEAELTLLMQKGYTRLWSNGHLAQIDEILRGEGNENLKIENEALKQPLTAFKEADIRILIDRFVVKKDDEENTKRMSDSVQTAFYESEGEAIVEIIGGKTQRFNNRFELDDMVFIEPTPQLFNYNNSFGACPTCEGYGKVIGIEEEKVIPDKTLSVYEGAIACWKGEKSGEWLSAFLSEAHKFDFPVHRPYQDLSKKEKQILWEGNKHFQGINAFFAIVKNLFEVTFQIKEAFY